MHKLLILALVFCASVANAQNKYYIPDPAFRNFLQGGYANCMDGDSLILAEALLETFFECKDTSVANLDGLQYFTGLTFLKVAHLPLITSVPEPLPNGLQFLDCYDNAQLVSLPVLPNGLQSLNCSNMPLVNLPILPIGLQTLDCSNIPLFNLPAMPSGLQTLECRSNQLTSLPALPSGLQVLDCSSNQLTSLPTLPEGLETLHCGYNQLTSLPMLTSGLLHLFCTHNSLTSLPEFPIVLSHLYCDHNQLTSLPTLPVNLLMLSCSSNQLGCLPVLTNALYYLYTDSTQITCLPNLPASLIYMTPQLSVCNATNNPNGCAVATAQPEITSVPTVGLYPNPTSGRVTLSFGANALLQSVQVQDVTGRVVYTGTTPTLDVSALAPGVYSVISTTTQGTVTSKLVRP